MYKYNQISEELEEEIYNSYDPGRRFPSEETLCKRFSVNRATIHKALAALEEKGLLERKGRGGSFVTDFINSGFDNRLIVVAMPLKGHMWDKLYIDISCHATEHERFVVAIDTTDAAMKNEGAEEMMFSRLKKALRFRPRTLILSTEIDLEEFLEKLGPGRRRFRNLIWLHHGSDISKCADKHLGQVCVDMSATWKLIAEQAVKSDYREISLFVPSISEEWIPLEKGVRDVLKDHGSGDTEIRLFTEENLQESLAELVNLAKSAESLAVICTYDFGAHLAVGALRSAGVQIPEKAGIYGINNTPWAKQDDLTTVEFNLELWSQKITECIELLEKSAKKRKMLISPIFVQRSSSL